MRHLKRQYATVVLNVSSGVRFNTFPAESQLSAAYQFPGSATTQVFISRPKRLRTREVISILRIPLLEVISVRSKRKTIGARFISTEQGMSFSQACAKQGRFTECRMCPRQQEMSCDWLGINADLIFVSKEAFSQ